MPSKRCAPGLAGADDVSMSLASPLRMSLVELRETMDPDIYDSYGLSGNLETKTQ